MHLNRRPDDTLCNPVDLIDLDPVFLPEVFLRFPSEISVFSVFSVLSVVPELYLRFSTHLRGLLARFRASAGDPIRRDGPFSPESAPC
jgi:hypothetical protein